MMIINNKTYIVIDFNELKLIFLKHNTKIILIKINKK